MKQEKSDSAAPLPNHQWEHSAKLKALGHFCTATSLRMGAKAFRKETDAWPECEIHRHVSQMNHPVAQQAKVASESCREACKKSWEAFAKGDLASLVEKNRQKSERYTELMTILNAA